MTDQPPTAAELDAALTDQDVTQTRIITLALVVGTLTMAAMAVVFAASQGEGRTDGIGDTGLIDILSLVHVAVFAACLFVRQRLAGAVASAAVKGRTDLDPARAAVERVKAALVVRLALLEGPALFGLSVIIVAASQDDLARHPLYGLNAFSTVVFVVLALIAFPNRQRLLEDMLNATA